MKRIISKTIILLVFITKVFGQTDTSLVYKKLEEKKFYKVSLSSFSDGKKSIYEANEKRVNKKLYKKYESTWKNMENCCPCILQTYDENEVLLHEYVSCTDCGVGWFKIYYGNGNIKLSGNYKENPTENWDDIYYRGYCNVPHGQWTYFNENGDILYSELWNNGEFIRQFPEQDSTEIWDVELTLNNQIIDTQVVEINQIKNLKINPKYKNSKTSSVLTIIFEVSAVGHKVNTKEFTIKSFKDIDVDSILSEVGIPKDKKTTYYLRVYSNNEPVKSFYLKVKR